MRKTLLLSLDFHHFLMVVVSLAPLPTLAVAVGAAAAERKAVLVGFVVEIAEVAVFVVPAAVAVEAVTIVVVDVVVVVVPAVVAVEPVAIVVAGAVAVAAVAGPGTDYSVPAVVAERDC